MKEIKFRAWSKVSKTMSPPATLNQLITAFVKGGWKMDGSLEVFQYTGLKDKNGKEIYEGDIADDFTAEDRYEVLFEDGCFWARLDGNVLCQLLEVNEDIEVIGNIYENPELLK